MLFIVWLFVGIVLDDDVLTSVVESFIMVKLMVSCEGSTDFCCRVDVAYFLTTVEGSRVLLDIVIDPVVEVGILLIVPALDGAYNIIITGRYTVVSDIRV